MRDPSSNGGVIALLTQPLGGIHDVYIADIAVLGAEHAKALFRPLPQHDSA